MEKDKKKYAVMDFFLVLFLIHNAAEPQNEGEWRQTNTQTHKSSFHLY